MDKIKISEIEIGERFRKDFGDLSGLKESMKDRGQFQPVVISQKKNGSNKHLLFAGECRIKVALELGWDEIGYIFREKADEITAREIELEENICRKQFTPEEEVMAVLEIHRLKVAKYGKKLKGSGDTGGWRLEDTAQSLGISKGSVVNYTTVAKHLEDMPGVREALKTKGVVAAFKQVRYNQEKEVSELLSKQVDQAQELAGEEVDGNVLAQAGKLIDACLFHGDCVDLIKKVANETVDLHYTDPPYAIFIDKAKKSDEFSGDIYTEDTPEKWMSTWERLAPELYRTAKKDSWAFIWISWEMVDSLVGVMEKAGWKTKPLPFYWLRQGVGFQAKNPAQNLASSVDLAMIFFKGNPYLNRQGAPNSSLERALPDLMKTHPLERPASLCLDNITIFVGAGSVVCDCFCGGGSIGKACLGVGINPILFEKDKNYYMRTRVELIGMLTGKFAEPPAEEVYES